MLSRLFVVLMLPVVGCAHSRAGGPLTQPASCADLSGSYSYLPDACKPWDGESFGGLPLADPGGYHVIRDPQTIQVEQTGCESLHFEARARTMHDAYDVETTLPLTGARTLSAAWSADGVSLEYRPSSQGPRFPGASSQVARLELVRRGGELLYRYQIVERGLALLLIPFRDKAGAECRLLPVAPVAEH